MWLSSTLALVLSAGPQAPTCTVRFTPYAKAQARCVLSSRSCNEHGICAPWTLELGCDESAMMCGETHVCRCEAPAPTPGKPKAKPAPAKAPAR